MSLEALNTIAVAEEKARQVRAAAGLEAKNMLRQAERAAADRVAQAEEWARKEIDELMAQSDEKVRADAEELASSTRNRQAAMAAHADRKMPQVVDGIVEHILAFSQEKK